MSIGNIEDTAENKRKPGQIKPDPATKNLIEIKETGNQPVHSRSGISSSPFLRFLLFRIIQVIPVLILATMLVFLITRLSPGDPATVQLGMRLERPGAQQALAQLRSEMGLDKPIPVQYLIWLSHVIRGDLGTSSRYELPVLPLILQKLPATLELIVTGICVALVLAIILGVAAAFYRGTVVDLAAAFISLVGVAVPTFWLALLLIIWFAVEKQWFPVSGFVSPINDLGGNLKHLILPAISLTVFELALFTRFVRSEMLEVLHEDYIRTAHSKGLPAFIILVKHALRNALSPVITIVALEFGTLFGGIVVIEQIFRWPGIGMLTIQAITDRDFPILQGVVLLVAVAVTGANLIADILYALLDPRIRYGSR